MPRGNLGEKRDLSKIGIMQGGPTISNYKRSKGSKKFDLKVQRIKRLTADLSYLNQPVQNRGRNAHLLSTITINM